MPHKAPIKGFIFDFDGVLVNTAYLHFLVWQRVAQSLKIPFEEKDNEALKGKSRDDSLDIILAMGGLSYTSAEKAKLMEQRNAWVHDMLHEKAKALVFDGVVDFIEKSIEAGLKIAIGSASRNVPLVLEITGLKKYFTIAIDGNMVTESKPNPKVFLTAAAGINLSPENLVVFEDSQAGVKAGNAGGFYTVGVGDQKTLQEANTVISGFNNLEPQSIIKTLQS